MRRWRLVGVFVGLIGAVLAGGCAVRWPTAAERASGSEIVQPAWPERTAPARLTAGQVPRDDTSARSVFLRMGGDMLESEITSPVRILYEEARPDCFVREQVSLDPETGRPRKDEPVVIRVTMAVPEVPASAPDAAEHPEEREVEFALFPPAPGATPRGLLFMLASLGGGSDPETALRGALCARGWCVLTSSLPWGSVYLRRFSCRSDGDLASAADAAATLTDGRLATWAIGTAAALRHLRERHPELITAPVAVLGCSAGAVAGPTVAARLRPEVGAVVLVAGGANIMSISRRTALSFREVQVDWLGGDLPPHIARRLDAMYLEKARLDPYHTAPALADIPVLELHAMLDTTVPADAGDLLHERLGRPERWMLPVGHKVLIWRLPAYADDLDVWLRRALDLHP